MRIIATVFALSFMIVCGASSCFAQSTAKIQRCIGIELYVRRSELFSQQVETGLNQWAAGHTGIKLRIFDLDSDPAAVRRLEGIKSYFQLKKSSLPLIYGCNQYLSGYRNAASFTNNVTSLLRIDAYVRSGCKHCNAAKEYLPLLQARYPGLEIRYFEIGSNTAAFNQLQQLIQHYQQPAVSVPVFHLCNQLVVGFDGNATSRRLESILAPWSYACAPVKQRESENSKNNQGVRPYKTSSLTPALPRIEHAGFDSSLTKLTEIAKPSVSAGESHGTEAIEADADSLEELPLPGDLPLEKPTQEEEVVEVPWFGRLSASRLGLPLFTIAVGLVDGFNPCAMWVLLVLLSVLVNLRSPKKILAVAGTFVFISGLVYFAFMAAWLNVMMFIGQLRWVQVILALLALTVGAIHMKDFFALKKGISLSIPESAKPGIYARVRRIVLAENLAGAIIGASILALLANFIELLCTAGLPAMYTQVLASQNLPQWLNYAYLILYNLAYMFDDSVMVMVVILTLGRRKMQERHGRWLKLVSGLTVFALGLTLLLKPEWLE